MRRKPRFYSPEEIAALDELARPYHEAEEKCSSGLDMEREGLLTAAEAAKELLTLVDRLSEENKALVEKNNELVVDYNELLEDYELLADEDAVPGDSKEL